MPTSVTEQLDTQKIGYQVANAKFPPGQGRPVRATVLQDKAGQILAITPADKLLDLQALNRALKRELRATRPTELKPLTDKYQLQTIPALPKLAGIPTVVDSSLLQMEELLLASGSNASVLAVKQADFKQALRDVEIAAISAELKADKGADDELEITQAVKNFTNRRIVQRLEETLELPSLPETAQRIINLRVDPNGDISDLASIVEMDPSLAAQVVSWASSPYYSAPGKIKSIHDAIVRVLGFDMVLNLALGLALGKSLNMPSDGPDGSESYWQQAVFVAATVEALVTQVPREHRPGFGMAYLSGLLSNFGTLVLAEVFPPQYSQICRLQEANPELPYQTIDRHVLGISRDQLSSWLMELWNMPPEVLTALRLQGRPDTDQELGEYAKLIYLARALLGQYKLLQGPALAIDEQLLADLNINRQQAYDAVSNIQESTNELLDIAKELNH
ncbi:MAG: HDOD domain-containing protein [Cellvibrionaceae bacterium]|nr:HDOD domain-containing protein [Cellvibrionaceae bacterium]